MIALASLYRRLLPWAVFGSWLAAPLGSAQTLEEPAVAHPEPHSAWEALVRADPEAAGELRLSERQVLEQLSPEQGQALANGVDPKIIVLEDGSDLATLLEKMGTFTISFWSTDAGGGVSTGGTFSLTATIGQADSGRLASACFVIDGGFLPAGVSSTAVFADGFEIGSAACWSSAVGSL
ncbi:MAG: hypothetical protein HC897_04240 [Thermoanaerobaculia bacterium]|nr:hypothetical protein [Thermoanaerobaculia bacterium]